jgi:hypothetical protein
VSPGVCLVGEGSGASLVGFMMAMDNKGLVQCGVMVNPVTDWKTVGKNIFWQFLQRSELMSKKFSK